ncbi:DNA-binding transcriptional regulator, LysR family [Roseivivax lentus]|uniref:DNA-binding transcriptional regulator, LysR family n=1 Tax=Roseivivax lentus TaxID=633194 RepID=A0A1N7LD60_9RHOB|nr:LysR family transcriptional regulator [Roseivivax lentus]SIS71758.1 DNA-binding transcriptional regulator, LysR family [Roseivivax lentus]
MDNWDDLRFLVALSRTGTMTAAAKMLGTNTATVSRRIDRLSETLGEAAFVKTASGWQPSPSVTKLIELAQTFDGELQSTLNARDLENPFTEAAISLGAPQIVTTQVLVPGYARSLNELNGITLTFSDRLLREGLGEHDIVVQMGAPEAGRIMTRKAGTLNFNFFRTVSADSALDDWIGLSETFENVPAQQMGFERFRRPPRVRVENFAAVNALVHATGLPGPLPDIMALRDPELTYLDQSMPSYPAEFWVMYHETRRSDPVMRRVVDWIMSCFSALEREQRTSVPKSA